MTLRRWCWLLSISWTVGTALQVDALTGPLTAPVLGVDVIAAPSMLPTLTTNQDGIIVCGAADVMLQESPTEIRHIKDRSWQAKSLLQQMHVSRYSVLGALRTAGVYAITGSGLANPY